MEKRYRHFAYTAFAVLWNWIMGIACFWGIIRSLFPHGDFDGAVWRGKFGCVCFFYFMIAKNINGILYQFSDMVESLIGGKETMAFSIADDTVLSKLQEQLFRLYDILRSYESREHQFRKQLNENIGNLVHQINTPITILRFQAETGKAGDFACYTECGKSDNGKSRAEGDGYKTGRGAAYLGCNRWEMDVGGSF